MATDIVPVEDPTVFDDDLVVYEGSAIPDANFSIEAAARGFTGVMLRDEEGNSLWEYEYPIGRKTQRGGNARLARMLMAMRGSMEVVDVQTEEGLQAKVVRANGAESEVIRLPAYRATVRVRDLLTNTTTVGRVTEALIQQRNPDKGGWYAVELAELHALGKAERNAILKHFPAIVPALLKLFRDEANLKLTHFSGQVPKEWQGQENAREIAIAKARERNAERVGETRANGFLARVAALGQQVSEEQRVALRSEWSDFQARRLKGKLAHATLDRLAEAERWLASREKALGVEVPEVNGEPEDEQPKIDDVPVPKLSNREAMLDEWEAIVAEQGWDVGAQTAVMKSVGIGALSKTNEADLERLLTVAREQAETEEGEA